MLATLKLPKTLLWVLHLLVIFLLLFTFYRLVTFIAFKPEGQLLSDYFSSFFLGLRFDLRWIGIALLPVVLGSYWPRLSPFHSKINTRIWSWYLVFITFFFIFFFAADFGCFSYNRTRLNASALNFAEDPGISMHMLWESYPLAWMIAGLVLTVLLLKYMFNILHNKILSQTEGKGIQHKKHQFLLAAVVLGLFSYGSFSFRPLQWKDAFRYDESFKSYLALNPTQNFFATLKFRKPQTDKSGAMDNFSTMAGLLGLKKDKFSFLRVVEPAKNQKKNQPNIVLVMCESFSMYKSSMSGNPLETTPFFKSLSDSGIFFNRCFTPHFSTARGLFATITGIPDVQLSKFSTRNPEALDQHTIINELENYKKYYFLGGSAEFNNFSGLVKNIRGVEMFTEGRLNAKPVNVWGVSDKQLFAEALNVFSKQSEPFFSIIQTADNHRPFTVPEKDSSFEKKFVDPEHLKKYGFESLEEYNAFRYFDHSIKSFMEQAKTTGWFANTIFVFVGDHGVSGNAKAVYPSVYTDERLTEKHVPLLFYAPGILPAEKRGEVVSQIDVLPTIAGLTGYSYRNTTLGRDLLNKRGGEDFAFIISHDEGTIGMVGNDFYYTGNLNFKKEEVHFFNANNRYSKKQVDSIKRVGRETSTAVYETAKYMLLNNKKF